LRAKIQRNLDLRWSEHGYAAQMTFKSMNYYPSDDQYVAVNPPVHGKVAGDSSFLSY
jgi:hypothetical protein